MSKKWSGDDTAFRGVACSPDVAASRVLGANPRRRALWLGAGNATRVTYSFGGAAAEGEGIFMPAVGVGTWVTREMIGQAICREVWVVASGPNVAGVAEISDCMCEDTEDI